MLVCWRDDSVASKRTGRSTSTVKFCPATRAVPWSGAPMAMLCAKVARARDNRISAARNMVGTGTSEMRPSSGCE